MEKACAGNHVLTFTVAEERLLRAADNSLEFIYQSASAKNVQAIGQARVTNLVVRRIKTLQLVKIELAQKSSRFAGRDYCLSNREPTVLRVGCT